MPIREPLWNPMVRLLRKLVQQMPGSSPLTTRDWCVSWVRWPGDRRSRRKICGASCPSVSGPKSMKAMFRPSGLTAKVFPLPPNDTPTGEFGSATARRVGKRLAGPSRRGPPPVGAHEEDALRGRLGRDGWKQRELLRHLEDHAGAIRQHRHALEDAYERGTHPPLRDPPRTRQTPERIGHRSRGRDLHDRDRVAVPAPDHELLLAASSAPAGRWCTRSPRRRASGCARPARCRCSARRRPPGSPGAPGRRRGRSACTRAAAACRCWGTPPRHFLAWLRATGQRSPRGTVLDDVTDITAYCDPLRGVNATAGVRDQVRLGAGAPLPTSCDGTWRRSPSTPSASFAARSSRTCRSRLSSG